MRVIATLVRLFVTDEKAPMRFFTAVFAVFVMGAWCVCATSVGPNSRRIAVASECHAHAFHPDHLVRRAPGALCMTGTWECIPTRAVSSGEAAYELVLTTGIRPGVPIWHLASTSCAAVRAGEPSTMEEPPLPEFGRITVSPHPDAALVWRAAMQDIFDPGEVLHSVGYHMLGGDWTTYGRQRCPDDDW